MEDSIIINRHKMNKAVRLTSKRKAPVPGRKWWPGALLFALISLLYHYNGFTQVLQFNIDYAFTNEDTEVDIKVLDNDMASLTIIDKNSVTVVIHPTLGKDSVEANGVIHFEPYLNLCGLDSFMYSACDTSGIFCDSAWVYITIKCINDKPVANDDTLITGINTHMPVKVLANDFDAENGIDSATLQLIGLPLHGSASVYLAKSAVIYNPDNNFLGRDSVRYLIKDKYDLNLKDTAWIHIFVVDTCVPSLCVWPGDANNDGIVNNKDLLPVGLAFGTAGPARGSGAPNIAWTGQFSTDWLTAKTLGKKMDLNFKYADTNGDGVVDTQDTIAIIKNYNEIRNKTGSLSGTESENPNIIIDARKDTVRVGDTLEINISLGSDTAVMQNIYGYAFSFGYEKNYVDSGSVNVDYSGNWLAPNGDYLHLEMDFYPRSQTDIAFTRVNHQGANGYGHIVKISFIIDNIDGKLFSTEVMNLSLDDVEVLDSNGTEIPVIVNTDSVVILLSEIGWDDPATLPGKAIIYPNPSDGFVQVRVTEGISVLEYQLTDLLGRTVIRHDETAPNRFNLDVSHLPNGTYLLRLNTQYGMITKQVLISR